MTLGLFYRGRISSIYGAAADGKSWVALLALREAVRRGQTAMLIDYEDGPIGIASRFVDLEMTPDELRSIIYRNPVTGIGCEDARTALAESETLEPTVVIIDSVGEAMAASGLDSLVDGDVAKWMGAVKAIARWPSRPAVVLIDHIPKNPENKSAGAIGSQRKLAAVTGAAYRTQQAVAFSQTKAGILRVTVEKDRLGNRGKGAVACEIHFTPKGGGRLDAAVRMTESAAAAERGERFRPTNIMERVSRWLEQNPGSSGAAIEKGVEGKASIIRVALDVLADEGYVSRAQVGSAVIHTLRKPYFEPLDLTSSHLVPPRPHLVPDEVGVQISNLVPSSPPLGDEGRGRGPGIGDESEPASTSSRPQPSAIDLLFGSEGDQ